jgi:hypothetical protein
MRRSKRRGVALRLCQLRRLAVDDADGRFAERAAFEDDEVLGRLGRIRLGQVVGGDLDGALSRRSPWAAGLSEGCRLDAQPRGGVAVAPAVRCAMPVVAQRSTGVGHGQGDRKLAFQRRCRFEQSSALAHADSQFDAGPDFHRAPNRTRPVAAACPMRVARPLQPEGPLPEVWRRTSIRPNEARTTTSTKHKPAWLKIASHSGRVRSKLERVRSASRSGITIPSSTTVAPELPAPRATWRSDCTQATSSHRGRSQRCPWR